MIWTKIIGPTVLSATTDVQLGAATLKMPAEAKSILSIKPFIGGVGSITTAEPIAAKITLQSNDFFIAPYICLTQCLGSNLAKGGIAPMSEAPEYVVNCAVKGGSELYVYGTGLFDHTVEPYAFVEVKIADYVLAPQYHAKISSFTNTGTAAAEVIAGTGIRITGGKAIREVNGIAVGTTVAASKGINSKFRLASSGFKGMGDIEFGAEPVNGVLLTDATTPSGVEYAKLQRTFIDAPITDPIDIDVYHKLGVALTTTGNFCVGVVYV